MNTTVPNNKVQGDTYSAAESNNVVNAINSKYDGDDVPLPVAGSSLGVVKNGGNVTVEVDGTMNAVGSAAVWGGITGSIGDQSDLQDALDAKASIANIQRTGTALAFDSEVIYGTIASPETGNITANLTGAALGVIVQVIHNNGTEPTFSSPFKKLSGSGSYVTGSLNYIFCEYIDSAHILYSISQAL